MGLCLVKGAHSCSLSALFRLRWYMKTLLHFPLETFFVHFTSVKQGKGHIIVGAVLIQLHNSFLFPQYGQKIEAMLSSYVFHCVNLAQRHQQPLASETNVK